ncbi:hypothetical protein CN481_24400, partial [Bacillus sp. AFS006103]
GWVRVGVGIGLGSDSANFLVYSAKLIWDSANFPVYSAKPLRDSAKFRIYSAKPVWITPRIRLQLAFLKGFRQLPDLFRQTCLGFLCWAAKIGK